MERITRTPALEIRFKTGSEGPPHDPYAYTEIRVSARPGATERLLSMIGIRPRPASAFTSSRVEITLHEGLGEWLQIGDVTFTPASYEHPGACRATFEALVGYSPDELEKFARRARSRCRCGSRRATWQRGYPGEEVLICAKCSDVLDCTFNESAVI